MHYSALVEWKQLLQLPGPIYWADHVWTARTSYGTCMGPEAHNYIAIEWILYSTQSNCFKREKRWYHESPCVCTWYYYGLYTDLHSVCVVSTRYECGLTPSKSKLDDFPCGSKSKTLHNASEKQATAESRQAQRNRLTPTIELETSYCSVPSLIHFYLQKQTLKPCLPFFNEMHMFVTYVAT